MPVETVAVVSQPAAPAPQIPEPEPEPKPEKAEAPSVSVSVSVCTPVNVTQNAESTAHSEATATNTNNNQGNANSGGNHADALLTPTPDSSASDFQGETPEQHEQKKMDEGMASSSNATDNTAPQTENKCSIKSPDVIADANKQKAEQPPQAADEIIAVEQADAAVHNDADDADNFPLANEEAKKPRGRTKFQTSQSLQYTVLCILCDLHKSNRDASLTAHELAVEARRKNKALRVDKTDCYKIINDLKLVLSNARSDWQISTGEYRLIAPSYGRAEKLKAQFEHLKE